MTVLGEKAGYFAPHHCSVPNVAFNFAGMRLTVRAAHDMPSGQPLLHCYGPQRGEATTALRRQQLQVPLPHKELQLLCLCLQLLRMPTLHISYLSARMMPAPMVTRSTLKGIAALAIRPIS